MDGNRFDDLARGVFSQITRRRTIGGLAGGALVTLGLADPEEAYTASSGKCKGGCDLCEKCDKGKCHKNNQGKKVCHKGKCKADTGETCTTTEGGLTYTAFCQSDKRCCHTTGGPCFGFCPNPALPCPVCCNTFCNLFNGVTFTCA